MKNPPSFEHHDRVRLLAICAALALLIAACGSSDDATTIDDAIDESTSSADADSDSTDSDSTDSDSTDSDSIDSNSIDGSPATSGGVDVGLFFDGALIGEPTIEDCTLSGGTETTCYSITVAGDPVSYETGPFCPDTIDDTAEAGGLWLDGENIYDVDGQFIQDLAEIYGDDNWQMFDEDGNVLKTETAEEFDLAARPDVDPSLQNHCVEGMLEWLENGEPVASTVLIPTEPVLTGSASSTNGNRGVTLDGVVIAAAAPVDAILGAYTIAAFDDCGGHYNPTDGYHLHGAVGCSEIGEASEGETTMFAYAMDGVPIHTAMDDQDSADLDECNGHDTGDGYHYHANPAAENNVLECMMGETVAAGGDAGGRPERPERPEDEG